MDDARAQQWQRLIDLLDEADAIQQSLLGETKDVECYALHGLISNLQDNFIDLANEEGVMIG
jgi:hypothetical protein